MDPEKATQIAEAALAQASKHNIDQAEAIVTASHTGATRFSNNAITQHQDQQRSELRLRVIKGQHQGVATGNMYDEASLDSMVERAILAATYSAPDPDLLPLIESQPEYTQVSAFDKATAEIPPQARADAVGGAITHATEASLESAGLLTAGSEAMVYAASTGVRAHFQKSNCSINFSAFAEDGKVEGIADGVAGTWAELPVEEIAKRAVEKALMAREAKPIEPGPWTVVFEPAAVSDMMLFLSWLGFSTQSHIEGRSALAGKLGETLFSEALTVSSDPYDAAHNGCPFDMEGYPVKPLTLIENGRVNALPHDRRTAAKMNAENTGHANCQPDSNGPMPGNISVAAGDSSLEELIASTERGLLLTQLHYTNTVDPMALSITGMTRGGSWLIENGKIQHAVTNLRFTDSLLRAFNSIEGISRERRNCGGGLFGGGMMLPSLKIRDFVFSSATE